MSTTLERLRTLAEGGDPEAQFEMGNVAIAGPSGAVLWYRRAGAQGHAGALHALGVLCRDGVGMKHDYAKAYAFFAVAGDQLEASAEAWWDIQKRWMAPDQIAAGQRLEMELRAEIARNKGRGGGGLQSGFGSGPTGGRGR